MNVRNTNGRRTVQLFQELVYVRHLEDHKYFDFKILPSVLFHSHCFLHFFTPSFAIGWADITKTCVCATFKPSFLFLERPMLIYEGNMLVRIS